MGTFAHIIKNWEKHNPEKVFTDIALVCFRLNVMLYYNNDKIYFEDGQFKFTSLNIIDDFGFVKADNNKQFILNIQGVNLEDIAVGLDKDLDYLIPNKKLCSLVYIEPVKEDNTQLLLRFAFEYLKLNPDEYFWFEWDYAFSFDDIIKLNKIPFDKNWCFKIPIETA